MMVSVVRALVRLGVSNHINCLASGCASVSIPRHGSLMLTVLEAAGEVVELPSCRAPRRSPTKLVISIL
jgi:hypothetical protein